jgi:hypothetical protein
MKIEDERKKKQKVTSTKLETHWPHVLLHHGESTKMIQTPLLRVVFGYRIVLHKLLIEDSSRVEVCVIHYYKIIFLFVKLLNSL